MKYLVLLGLVALVSLASCKPCKDCIVVKESDEEFRPIVRLLNLTLSNLAATKEGPFFTLVKTYSAALSTYDWFPTVTADLKDREDKVQRCDVTVFKPLDVEDRTTEFKATFDCENYKSTAQVNLIQ